MNHPKIIRTGYHNTFGWLRRSELDDDNGFCYEAPDGDLVFSGSAHHKNAMLLYELIDPETGDHYLVDRVGLDC